VDLRFEGNSVLTEAQLRASIPFAAWEIRTTHARDQSVSNIRIVYAERSYNDVGRRRRVDASAESGRMALSSDPGGRQEIIRDIQVSGLERTSHGFVLDLLELKNGDVNNPDE
jgi:hypothetical protein